MKVLVVESSISQVGRYRDAFAELRRGYNLQIEATFGYSVKGLKESLRNIRLYDVIFVSGELEDWGEQLPFIMFQLSIHHFKGVVVAATADEQLRGIVKYYAERNELRTADYTKPNQSDERLNEIFDALTTTPTPA